MGEVVAFAGRPKAQEKEPPIDEVGEHIAEIHIYKRSNGSFYFLKTPLPVDQEIELADALRRCAITQSFAANERADEVKRDYREDENGFLGAAFIFASGLTLVHFNKGFGEIEPKDRRWLRRRLTEALYAFIKIASGKAD